MSWDKDNDILALMCGHGVSLDGGWDPGTVYMGYTEADLMFKITREAVKYLRKSGIKVLTDADKGNNRNMVSCVRWANNKGAKLYMSVHCDWFKAPSGVAPLYVSAKGEKFATTVGRSVAKDMGMKFRGAYRKSDLYELNETDMPAVIFETGGIKSDLKKLRDYRVYGKALAKGICKYLKVDFVK